MTGFANRPWSIVWNRSLKRSLIRVALGIVKAAKPSDALGKIWREMGAGNEWIVRCGSERIFCVRGSLKAQDPSRKASRLWQRVESDSTDAEGGLRGRRDNGTRPHEEPPQGESYRRC